MIAIPPLLSGLEARKTESLGGCRLLTVVRCKEEFDSAPIPNGNRAREMDRVERLDDGGHRLRRALNDGFA